MNKQPFWLKALAVLGLPTFLLLWIMGAFHTILPSPVTAAIERHERGTERALRMICRGVWKGDEVAQLDCDR
jgi:hypothetical protein